MEDTAEAVGATIGGEKFEKQTQTRVRLRAGRVLYGPWTGRDRLRSDDTGLSRTW